MPALRSPAGTAVAREDGVERDADGHGWDVRVDGSAHGDAIGSESAYHGVDEELVSWEDRQTIGISLHIVTDHGHKEAPRPNKLA